MTQLTNALLISSFLPLLLLSACEQDGPQAAGGSDRLQAFNWRAAAKEKTPKAPTATSALSILKDRGANMLGWSNAAVELERELDSREASDAAKAPDRSRLSTLILRRMKQLCRRAPSSSRAWRRFEALAYLTRSFARLDPKQARGQLASFSPCFCLGSPDRADEDSAVWCAWHFALRVELGDPKAMGEYLHWLNHFSAREIKYLPNIVLLPVWRHPDHPDVAALLTRLFGPNSKAGPWTVPKSEAYSIYFARLVNSPLLGTTDFRNQILTLLDDRSPVHGQTAKRVCDYTARSLSEIDGAPIFRTSWSRARRNAAIVAMQAFLEKQGPKLGGAGDLSIFDIFAFILESTSKNMQACLPLSPQLNTPKASAGRLVPLLDLEVDASWKKEGEKWPIRGRVYSGWEVRQHGKSRRFYLFAWSEGVARLPAEVLDFHMSSLCDHKAVLSPRFRLCLQWPDVDLNHGTGYPYHSESLRGTGENTVGGYRYHAPTAVYRTSRPLMASVFISNRSGYEQTRPVWTKPLPGDERPDGIRIRLKGPAGVVPRREDADEESADESKTLLPGETQLLFKLDLNAHFDIKTLGSHYLLLEFEDEEGCSETRIVQGPNFPIGMK